MLHVSLAPEQRSSLNNPPSDVVDDELVPILVSCPRQLRQSLERDLLMRQLLDVLERNDSRYHVARIADELEIDIDIVRHSLRNLMLCGAIRLLPAFRYSNCYVATGRVHELLYDRQMASSCLERVVRGGGSASSSLDIREVLRIFCAMEMGVQVKDLFVRLPQLLAKVDVQRLVQFGLLHELIRHVRRFPVFLGAPPAAGPGGNWLALLNGDNSADSILCQASSGSLTRELAELIENDRLVVSIFK